TTSTSAHFVFSSTGTGPITYQCYLDGDPTGVACNSGTMDYSSLTYGSHELIVVASNGGGLSPQGIYDWGIQPPAPALTSSPNQITSQTTANFTFTDGDPGATVIKCSLDGATFTACSTSTSQSYEIG